MEAQSSCALHNGVRSSALHLMLWLAVATWGSRVGRRAASQHHPVGGRRTLGFVRWPTNCIPCYPTLDTEAANVQCKLEGPVTRLEVCSGSLRVSCLLNAVVRYACTQLVVSKPILAMMMVLSY